VEEHINELSTKPAYQRAVNQVTRLEQCTRTLWVQDLHTLTHRELDIELYIEWLRWLQLHPRCNELDEVLSRRGKQNWPAWAVDTFGQFQQETSSRFLIVLSTPPPELFQVCNGEPFWVVIRWISGSLHAGYDMRKSKLKNKAYRVTLFLTEPDSSGNFFSGPSFLPKFKTMQLEMDDIVRNGDSLEDIRAKLDAGIPRWHKTGMRCMSGPSHASFSHRLVTLVASQPSKEAMLAALWQTSELSMSLDEDPTSVLQAREDLIARCADVNWGISNNGDSQIQQSPLTVSGICGIEDGYDQISAVLTQLYETQVTRMHNYFEMTSGMSYPLSFDPAVIFSEERKLFRRGPYANKKVNVGDSCHRLTDQGFGIPGVIFAFPHSLFR